MAADYSICLDMSWNGWLGRMAQSGCRKSWIRHRAPFPLNSRIQTLVAHPTQAHTVLAGGDTGLFVSYDGGARWERISANGALPTIWSLTIEPVNPDILFVGHGGAPLLGPHPSIIRSTGQEHGRTIPLAANKSAAHSADKPRKPTIRSCASDDAVAPKPAVR
jgi:hypothetical protein